MGGEWVWDFKKKKEKKKKEFHDQDNNNRNVVKAAISTNLESQ